MKRTLTSFALLIIGTMSACVYAGPRNRQQAMAIAQAKANSLGVTMLKTANRRKVASATADEDSVAGHYIFNNGNNNGWTIVSGDDRIGDIIAYSDEGSLDEDNLPDVVKDILGSVDRKVAGLGDDDGAQSVALAASASSSIPVGPLCVTKWDQYEPYSNNTPTVSSGQHSATCCVVTAFAQILYYLYYTQGGQESTTFTKAIPTPTNTAGYKGSAVAADDRTYNWSLMLTDYAGKDYTEEQAAAVAKLMADIGSSFNVKYGTSSSTSTTDNYMSSLTGSNYPHDVGPTYWGIAKTSDLTYNGNVSSVTAWKTAIDSELDKYYPVQIAGNGHAFVCDGRDSNNMYHMNFGYDGRGDGFYSFDAVDGYDKEMRVTCGLRIENSAPSTGLEKLQIVYNAAKANIEEESVGNVPGYYQQEYYDALQDKLAEAKAALDNNGGEMSDDQLVSLATEISEAEQDMLAYRTPYLPGTYYIKNFAETTKDVAMYASGRIVKYGAINTEDDNYKWELIYNEEADGYTIKNVGTGTYINSASDYSVSLGNNTVYCEIWPTNRITDGNSRFKNDCWDVSYTNSIRPITDDYRDDDHGYIIIYQEGTTSGNLIGWQTFNDWDVWVPVPIDVSNVPKATFEVESMQLKTGDTATNKLTTNSDGAVTYSSSDEKVATVDAAGVVTAVGPGDATITVSIAETEEFAGKSVSYTVEVNNNYPTITFAKKSVTVKVECTVSNPAITDSDGPISYSSSNTKVATVDRAGIVTGVGVGRATINVSSAKTANNAAASGSFTVSVSQNNELNTKLASLVAEAEGMYTSEELDSVNAIVEASGQKIVSTTGLIISADQFSSPYTETSEGSFANLLDGKSTTFWHSAWSGGSVAADYHYFDVKLNEASHSLIELSMTRRSNATNDHITKLRIQYSSDGSAYDEFGTVDLPYASASETKTADFTVPADCQYLRFYLAATTTGRGYGHMGEFQLYDVTVTYEATDLQKALYELGKEVASSKSATYATSDIINSLQAAIDKYKACQEATGIKKTNAEQSTEQSIYSLQGVRRNSVVKGINIVNGKKVYVK